jgi:hypothetical protein
MGKSGAVDDDFGSQGPKMKLALVLEQLTRCKPALAQQFRPALRPFIAKEAINV